MRQLTDRQDGPRSTSRYPKEGQFFVQSQTSRLQDPATATATTTATTATTTARRSSPRSDGDFR